MGLQWHSGQENCPEKKSEKSQHFDRQTLLFLFRGLVRRQTNTKEHNPETCQGNINKSCPVPNFESPGPQVR